MTVFSCVLVVIWDDRVIRELKNLFDCFKRVDEGVVGGGRSDGRIVMKKE
jgi:hypothetical protein